MLERTRLIFVMGPTCAGKSTLLHATRNQDPESVGLVEVGKMLRAKYPPTYFAGQNNPKHTAAEAWNLCEEGVISHREAGKKVVLVDGQPRDIPQVAMCIERFPDEVYDKEFVLIDAKLEERERRARASRQGEDLEKLAIPRLTNDMIANYQVMVELLKRGETIRVFDMTNPDGVSTDLLFQDAFGFFFWGF